MALSQDKRRRNRLILIFGAVIAAVVVVTVIAVALAVGLSYGLDDDSDSSGSSSATISDTYKNAAVATDAARCSEVGVEILRKGGSAVDAAIASLLCVGVINMHSTGIGGGGFLVYYNATSKKATVIDHRETAPGMANYTGVTRGGSAIAIPGELRGLEMAHQKYGTLPWKELFEPAAQIAEEGFLISPAIATAINRTKERIESGNFTGLKELLAPEGQYLKEGDTIHRTKYAQTLRAIGESGDASYFYEGQFMEQMVRELQEAGAPIDEEDFLNYTAIEREPVETYYEGHKVIGHPPPSSGAVLALMLNILQGYNFNSSDFGSLAYHRIVESFKFAFGQRLQLGDPAFNDTVNEVVQFMLMNSTADDMRSRIKDNTTFDPDYYTQQRVSVMSSDSGTSHLCVLAPNGDAVAATSTVNFFFGSLVRSTTSGIIFNNEMDDFDIPSQTTYPFSVSNSLEPGKRPQSSMSPTIILNGEKVKMVVGSSGGRRIITANAQVILDVLNFGRNLSQAISYPRLHHQLYPNKVTVEREFPGEFREGLEERGHVVEESSSFAVVQGILAEDDEIQAFSDPRKGGKAAGY